MAGKRFNPRGFTLVEVIVATMITAFLIASVSGVVGQLTRAKNSGRQRLAAYLRADAALNAMRRDIASVTRDTDLFQTRLVITDGVAGTEWGEVERDEILLFNTQLRAVRDLTYQGEGIEYETQYRVEDDSVGSMLWQRRDSVPDEWTLGGGQAKPFVENIIGVSIEAYDGTEWRQEWDSDRDGLPLAVRVELTANGLGDDYDNAGRTPLATLRTVIAVDRVVPPKDTLLPTEEEELELEEYLTELLAPLMADQSSAPESQGDIGGPGGFQSGDQVIIDSEGGQIIQQNDGRLTPAQRERLREQGGRGPNGAGGNRPGGGGGGGSNPDQPSGRPGTGGTGGGTGTIGGGGGGGQ